MRFILLALTLFLTAIAPALAQGEGVAVVPDLSAAGRFDFKAEVDRRYGRTLEVIRAEFPRDHAALMAEIAAIKWQRGGENDALLAAFGAVTELKKKYAARLQFAPSAKQAVMLENLAKFYVAVSGREGPEVCGQFASDGAGVLFARGLSGAYAAAIDIQSAAYFEAVAAALETPEYISPVRPDDWGVVVSAMVSAGAPPSFAKTISDGNPADPDLCPALAAMFVTSAVLNAPEGTRIRADFAKNLAGY
ncbi:MAG TPA: hypothetical protein PK286_11205 [Devosia sp.]|mgnify:CR=1 FL=1|nr:hypothetical protein [Devosia sp.]